MAVYYPPLAPVGGATSANQVIEIGLLTSIEANQTNGTQVTTVSGSVTVVQPTGTNLHTVVDNFPSFPVLQNVNIADYGGVSTSLGQKVSASSIPVVLASDQSAIPVTQSGTWNLNNITGTISLPTGASTAANQTTANTSLASILANQTNGTQETQVTNFPALQNVNLTEVSGVPLTMYTISQPPGIEMLPVMVMGRNYGQILTTTLLGANAVYTSPWFDTNQTGTIGLKASSYSNVASATNGFVIQTSNDDGNANFTSTPSSAMTTAAANTLANVIYSTRTRYWRVQYTNGAVAQSSFELTVEETQTFSPVEAIADPTGTTTALVVRQVIPATMGSFQETATTTVAQFPSNLCKGMTIKCPTTNSDFVAIGTTGVTAATGYILQPGDAVGIDCSNTNEIYYIGNTTGQTVSVLWGE
jgi:hypothetical protein